MYIYLFSRCTSFPDSNSGLSGDVNFTFRMRKDNAPILPGHKGFFFLEKKRLSSEV